ncbi:unnamed protein product [Closterium sp. NIES-54]
MAAQELRWLTYLLTDLGEPPRSPPVLYVDNKAMLALCREQRLEHRTKHIALRYFLARELQQRGQLRLAYVASEANTADWQRAAPHSSEFPPTTASLQTLHMDVWGPAPVGGTNQECYFLLVVDDYTRYTTVFPLRRKADVSSFFIPWIRATRRQLRDRFSRDLPFLRLHSDRGGEISSGLLAEFCQDEGIRQSFTLPASPRKNGIAECRIGLIMEVARTSMIHAVAPRFLWPFAVRYAAHQLNLWPRVSLPEISPTLRWTGQIGDASVFWVWGALSLVRDTTASKLSPRTLRCVFLRFPTDAPPWHFYHPSSRRVFSSHDVTFDESVFYYRLQPHASHLVPLAPLFLVDPPPFVEPLEISSDSFGLADGGDPAADDTAATRRSPRLETPLTTGAEPGAAEAKGEGSRGAATGGAATGGAGSGGAETGGTDSGDAASPGGGGGSRPAGGPASAGGARGAAGGAAGARGTRGATGAGVTGAASAVGAGAAGAGGAGGTAGAGGTRGATGAGGTGATSPTVSRGAGGAGGTTGAGGTGAASAGGPAGTGGTGLAGVVRHLLGLLPAPTEFPVTAGAGAGGWRWCWCLVLAAGTGAGAWCWRDGAGAGAGAGDGAGDWRWCWCLVLAAGAGAGAWCWVQRRVRGSVGLLAGGCAGGSVGGSTGGSVGGSAGSLAGRLAGPLASPLAGPSAGSQADPSAGLRTRVLAGSWAHWRACWRVRRWVRRRIRRRARLSTCELAGGSVGGIVGGSVDGLAGGSIRMLAMGRARHGQNAMSRGQTTSMDAETATWKSTGTYVNEVPPPRANIVSGMWIFRVKRPPGSPPAFKARYVARGFSQREGVDFFQTFYPTPKMTTLRVLLLVAAQRDYELHSLNISTAFLQVYGLRQAPHEWHDTLRTTLAALGFDPSTADPSLFLRTDTTLPPFYVLVYVDDLVFVAADTEALALVKAELQERHTCTDMGELRSYLGLQITQDRARRTITLTQSHMVHQVLQRFGFQFSLPQPTPLSTDHSLSAPPLDKSVEPSGPYPELVGCLMYLMTCTRPDLGYPLSLLARYVAPGRHRKGSVVLAGHSDASWADDQATQRSSQGYTFSLGSGFVLWRSTHSSYVLGSNCEAEMYAGAMAAQELRWLTYLLTDLGEQPRSPPVMYVDNKSMLALCHEQRLEHRTKHIALHYFLAHELQQRRRLRLSYVASRANTSDVFTKALGSGDHQRFCTALGLVLNLPHLLVA